MSKRERRKRQQAGRREIRDNAPYITVCQYGPDDKTVTKVVAAVFKAPNKQSGPLRRWVGSGIKESPKFRQELLDLVIKTGAGKLVLTTGVVGCIHEEGKDYPDGEECPFCPFWKGRDRWANAKPIIVNLGKRSEPDIPWPI